MSEMDEKDRDSASVAGNGQRKSVSRRALIKGGVTAMPAILTLKSGAAMAYASAMTISAAHPATKDRLGRTLCLDTNSVYPAYGSRNAYDMGNPPRASLNVISKRVYYRRKSRRSPEVPMGQMCRGGTYWYKDGHRWKKVRLPYKGVVVSSGAMASVADHIYDTLI